MKNPLRISCVSFVALLGSILAPQVAPAENLPDCRPALLTNGRRSLVNLINLESLVKQGQGNATVMFSCGVNSLGFAGAGEFYRGTPNSEKLGREVVRRIDNAQFEPAVYHHTHVGVWISGTVTFIIKDGKPHLRVFLNQEEDDLLKGRDFIAPQYVNAPDNYKFRGIRWPANAPGHDGFVAIQLTIDAEGKVQGTKLEYEYPPNLGFGRETNAIRDAWFIPGFREGKPGPCRFTWVLHFEGPGLQMKTG